MAILTALDKIEETQEDKFVICTDSKAGLEALKNKKIENNYIIEEILIKLENTKKQIKLQWVPGHKGIIGNEVADRLSKEGCTADLTISTTIPLADALILAKKETIHEWNTEYTKRSQHKGTKHYTIHPKITLKPWFHQKGLNKQEILTIGRLRTFHTLDKTRLYLWKLENDDKCTECQVGDTTDHALFKCTKYINNRHEFKCLQTADSTEKLLQKANTKTYRAVAKFITKNSIKL